MRKMRVKIIALTVVTVVALFGLLATSSTPSSGQEQRAPTGRTTAHLLCCGRLVSVPGTWFGADRRCTEYLQDAPENVRTDACKYMKDAYFFSDVSCIRSMESICPEAKPPKCKERDYKIRAGGPWFDPGAEGCQNLQDIQVTATYSPGKCTLTLRACNLVVASTYFTSLEKSRPDYKKGVMVEGPPIRKQDCKPELYGQQMGEYPQKVCCDIWQEVVRSGGPCNPEVDADCDGLPNDRDGILNTDEPYYAPGDNYYGTVYGESLFPVNPKDFNPADFDPRPPGLGWDELMPNEPCELCKWVALSGKLTCSPDGRRDHEYKATWKCPVSGVERVVTKRVPARFPCTPPKRPRPRR